MTPVEVPWCLALFVRGMRVDVEVLPASDAAPMLDAEPDGEPWREDDVPLMLE
ncbi:hypothetical protein LTR53_020488, partial [Teratosphaeriaceae sp. CCFEE 6253]